MRILTGIQSTGTPHLGNLLGAILPAIDMGAKPGNDAFLFIADLHSFTAVRDPQTLRDNTYAVAAAWLACGLDVDHVTFYRQSDVPEVAELTWFLGCRTPYPMLANAHSFKDKSDNVSQVNAGLFYYPVLMAADILLYDTDIVPVGKDQKQHLEITRDIASAFNRAYGDDTFVMPTARIDPELMTVPGTDGRKMSKSYGNTINIFLPEKELKKTSDGHRDGQQGAGRAEGPRNRQRFPIVQAVGLPCRCGHHARELRARRLRIRPCQERIAGTFIEPFPTGTRKIPSIHDRCFGIGPAACHRRGKGPYRGPRNTSPRAGTERVHRPILNPHVAVRPNIAALLLKTFC
jgi:tryptophanyl-tRNA synthetase